eukprot:CAMPEP_0202344652 /NCGR_PEP_ID=MMETSP1126-20121109/4241_1 /ASSEMBLY_ACC=CAM_ASM_000457 /TAXON_ID=3047 /ORGANISM="Dunaliella tertiolecta, Strain CCMP1320" /LENGTH=106 /DNA_ID=CAMNT_0048935871 /DNA_START=714 /DNA_END=1034 /DNA_ORIENTATION=+
MPTAIATSRAFLLCGASRCSVGGGRAPRTATAGSSKQSCKIALLTRRSLRLCNVRVFDPALNWFLLYGGRPGDDPPRSIPPLPDAHPFTVLVVSELGTHTRPEAPV